MRKLVKRAFDIAAATAGLIALGPLFLIVSLAIKLTSRGPVFFLQERVGRNFQAFNIIKFRTMVVDAPVLGGQLTAGDDPRITFIGGYLRRAKIDELPQLFNVLKGDMSLVGPRPEVAQYVQYYRKEYEQLLSIRPGITDLASLKYRHEAELLGQSLDPEETYRSQILPDKIALSQEYIRNSSFWFDLRLIFKTLLRMPT